MAFKTIRGSFADMAGRSPGVYIAERAASQGALRVMLEVKQCSARFAELRRRT
jgi:hypothetical protein